MVKRLIGEERKHSVTMALMDCLLISEVTW